MDRMEFLTNVSPPCHECGEPVRCVEIRWVLQGEDWVPGPAWMICVHDHRVRVALLDLEIS